MKRASKAVTLHAGGIARATVIDNDNGGCTRSEDPALSCLLRREEQQSRQCPLRCGFATSTLRSCCTPAIPADTLSAGRPHKTAHAPRQRLAQAGCRVTPILHRGSTVSSVARRLRLFDRLPTGSFQQQQIRPSGPSNRVASSLFGATSTPPTGGYHPHARKRRERTIGVRAITRTSNPQR